MSGCARRWTSSTGLRSAGPSEGSATCSAGIARDQRSGPPHDDLGAVGRCPLRLRGRTPLAGYPWPDLPGGQLTHPSGRAPRRTTRDAPDAPPTRDPGRAGPDPPHPQARPPFTWDLIEGPWFDNNVAMLTYDQETARLQIYRAMLANGDHPTLDVVADRPLEAHPA